MANNCLVTKLMGSVDNQNLNVLGQFSVKVGHVFSNEQMSIGGPDVKWTLSDGSFANMDNVNVGNTVTTTSDRRYYKLTTNSNDCELIIKNFYNITYLYPNPNPNGSYFGTFPTKYFKWGQLKGCQVKFDGNITDLSSNINLEELRDMGQTLSGDIKDFVIGLISNGTTRTNMILYISGSNNILKFNNVIIQRMPHSFMNQTCTLNWSSATKMYIKCSAITCIACLGYTDEEIAELTASGGAWYGYTVDKVD